QATSMIAASHLDVTATMGSVSLSGKNAVDVISSANVGPGGSLFFRNDSHPLTIGTTPNTYPVTAPGGTIIVETTTSGDLVLIGSIDTRQLNGGLAGKVALGSAGTIITNAAFPMGGPPSAVLTSELEILSQNLVSLGMPPQPQPGPPGNTTNPRVDVNTVAGLVVNAGQGFILRSAADLTIGSVDVMDTFHNRLMDPMTGVA